MTQLSRSPFRPSQLFVSDVNSSSIFVQPAWPALKGEGKAGIWGGREGEFLPSAPHTLSRAPKFPLPLPLSTPATQAKFC